MSLQQLAQTVQSRGRGDDSVLIHMTPREVQGLQSLAMAHGGSLTINPDTGLPEAGFLSNILPALFGAGLSIISGGALTPLMAAGILGGGTALLTGNLQKGLMAGLGAYGGAGIGAGLTGAGASAAQAGAQAAMQPVAQTAAALGTPAATGAGSQAAALAAQNAGFGEAGLSALQQAASPAVGAAGMPAYDPTAGAWANTADAARLQTAGAMNQAAADATTKFLNQPWYKQVGAGIKGLGSEAGRTAALEAMGGGKKAMQYGLAALAPSALATGQQAQAPEDTERYLYQWDREQRDPNAGYTGPYSGERRYFGDSRLTRVGMAEGGAPEDKFQMSGESKAAYDYLMGRSSVSPGTVRAREATAAVAPTPGGLLGPATSPAQATSTTTSDRTTYNFDPVTGRLIPITIAAPRAELRRYSAEAGGGGGYDFGGGYGDFGGVNGSAGSGYGSDSDGMGTSMAAHGGIVGLAKGGLARGGFVVPADVVSMLGEGSTDAGMRILRAKYGIVKAIKGPGTGQSDSIPTSIEGGQPARVADGEAYVPPEVVAKHGGAKKFYDMLNRVRAASQGHTKQQRRINPERVMA